MFCCVNALETHNQGFGCEADSASAQCFSTEKAHLSLNHAPCAPSLKIQICVFFSLYKYHPTEGILLARWCLLGGFCLLHQLLASLCASAEPSDTLDMSWTLLLWDLSFSKEFWSTVVLNSAKYQFGIFLVNFILFNSFHIMPVTLLRCLMSWSSDQLPLRRP